MAGLFQYQIAGLVGYDSPPKQETYYPSHPYGTQPENQMNGHIKQGSRRLAVPHQVHCFLTKCGIGGKAPEQSHNKECSGLGREQTMRFREKRQESN